MNRRVTVPNPHAARASGDRWLFGYADIVTLLLACFASLYAAGIAPAATPAAAAVQEQSSEPTDAAVPTTDVVEPAVAEPAEPVSLELAFESLLGDTVALPGTEMTTSARGLVISLPEAGSFPAGRAELSPSAIAAMYALAARLRDVPNLIRVEGHTDDVPIATAQFASNWDLSAARATRVVEFLIEEGEIDPMRLAAAGYAEFRPRLPNTTAEQRARNRRVDIVVLDPDSAGVEEPGSNPR